MKGNNKSQKEIDNSFLKETTKWDIENDSLLKEATKRETHNSLAANSKQLNFYVSRKNCRTLCHVWEQQEAYKHADRLIWTKASKCCQHNIYIYLYYT